MVGWKMKEQNSKEKIISAALKEFSLKGLEGARMESIARNASVNKAMLFYYFNSKSNLYSSVISYVFSNYFKELNKIFTLDIGPSEFFEKIPKYVIPFFMKNRDFYSLIIREFFFNGESLVEMVKNNFKNINLDTPKLLKDKVNDWYDRGLITESDPINFFINMVSVCVFSFIAKPVASKFFEIETVTEDEFYKSRIKSIENLLKNGMLA